MHFVTHNDLFTCEFKENWVPQLFDFPKLKFPNLKVDRAVSKACQITEKSGNKCSFEWILDTVLQLLKVNSFVGFAGSENMDSN